MAPREETALPPKHADPAPSPQPKPLWRFGWAGWLSLVLGLPAVGMAVLGVNPVYEAQRLVMERWGVAGMFDFTIYSFVYPWMQLGSVAPGPYALLWLLLGFGVSPRPVSVWWYAFFAALCLGAPLVHAPMALQNFLGVTYALQAVGLPEWATLTGIELLLLGGGLWRFTRSWRVFAAFAVVTLACWVPWEIAWSRGVSDAFWITVWRWTVGAWHVSCAAIVLAWAIGRRRRAGEGDRCESCGYDLRGIAGDRCPECGAVPVRVGADA